MFNKKQRWESECIKNERMGLWKYMDRRDIRILPKVTVASHLA